MRVDNSQLLKFFYCPAAFQERYVNNIEPKPYISDGPASALDFGSAFHKLLEAHFKAEPTRQELWDGMAETLKSECEYTFEKYLAQYPEESWEVVDVERLIEVPLDSCDICNGRGFWLSKEGAEIPCEFCDIYVAKLDLVVRRKDNGMLSVVDHKTEERGSLNNSPQKWQFNTQVSLYQWAAEQIYNESIYNIIIDIIQRRSPGGRCEPEFRRLEVHRSNWQQAEAVATLKYVLGQMKHLLLNVAGDELFPQNRDNCYKWRIPCAYAKIHGEEGRDENILKAHFQEAEDYLNV